MTQPCAITMPGGAPYNLTAIFDDPVLSNIPWRDIEVMLNAAEAEITQGDGSRVRIALNGLRAV